MLRAIGMTRRQMRRMIRHESVITALIGGFLGIILGIALGGLLVARIDFIDFSLPVGTLIVFTIATIVVGIIAAILPGAASVTAERARGASVRVAGLPAERVARPPELDRLAVLATDHAEQLALLVALHRAEAVGPFLQRRPRRRSRAARSSESGARCPPTTTSRGSPRSLRARARRRGRRPGGTSDAASARPPSNCIAFVSTEAPAFASRS